MDGKTHAEGHTLDLMMTQKSSGLVRSTPKVSATGLCNSRQGKLPDDHHIVICVLEMQRPIDIEPFKKLRF